jgi:hypothetical protein
VNFLHHHYDYAITVRQTVRPGAGWLRPNIESFELGILRDSRSASKRNLAALDAAITARAILSFD